MEGLGDVLETGYEEAAGILRNAAKKIAQDEESFLRKKERIARDMRQGSRLSSKRLTVDALTR